MASNAQRGAYFKNRSRQWLIAHGWQVADLEIVKTVYPGGFTAGGGISIKRDQFGADLFAMRSDDGINGILFVQVKGGKQAIGAGKFPAAQREFARFAFPVGVQRWIMAWAPRARHPRIVMVDSEAPAAGSADNPVGGTSARSRVDRAVENIGPDSRSTSAKAAK